jgi:hypothetical protein
VNPWSGYMRREKTNTRKVKKMKDDEQQSQYNVNSNYFLTL